MSIFLSVDVVNEWCDKSPYTGNFDRKWFIDLGLTANQMRPVVMYVAKTKTVEKPAPLNAL